jgi:pimeloyl-ACP methyl ester carboxylesterase
LQNPPVKRRRALPGNGTRDVRPGVASAARIGFLSALLALASCSDRGAECGDPSLQEFCDQPLEWSACGESAPAGMECSAIDVPRDYADPHGPAWTIALGRLPATGGEALLGTIVMNPGGPGNSGIRALSTSGSLYDRLRTRYDIVSFDPRGIGASRPAIDCLSQAQATAIRNQVSNPTTPAEQALAYELGREQALTCQSALGESLGLFGTRNVARDMDVLRAVLGESRLDYFGVSYGTYLGAVYAELFPGRTDRMVLDSAMNPANDYERLRHDQAVAFYAAIERFVADCPAHPDCPLVADVPRAIGQLAGLIGSLDAEPFVAADGRVLSGSRALNIIESSMYAPEQGWPDLRRVLGPALAGDLEPLLEYAYGSRQRVNPADSPYLAVMCHDLQLGRDPAVIPELAAAWALEAPLNGANRAWSVLPCTEWRAMSDIPPAPIEATGSGAILVLGVVGDPATPIDWARALAATLAHGRLLEWEGQGHKAYGRGGPCIDSAVESFFFAGVLPPEGSVCPP